MIQGGPTEQAYRKWINRLGPLETAYQEYRAQDVIRTARALDLLPLENRSRLGLIEAEHRLLKKLRAASRDLRDSIAEYQVIQPGGVYESSVAS